MPRPDGLPKLSAETLSTVLSEIRLSDSFYCKTTCRGRWGFTNPPRPGAIFHFVVEGRAIIETSDGEAATIEAGELALLQFGKHHVLKGQPRAPVSPLESLVFERTGANSSSLTLGRTGSRSVLVCGGVTFEPSWHPLFEMLPTILCLRREGHEDSRWVEALVELMGLEVSAALPGTEPVITRLCELLVIGTIRHWMMHDHERASGWVVALRDRHLGRALAKIHQAPHESWTVASLASAAALSRTVFAERFCETVGIPPMQYLGCLRMNLAGDKLRDSTQSIEQVAEELGYSSEVSFSRAFKRFWGKPPGSFRRAPEVRRSFGLDSAVASL